MFHHKWCFRGHSNVQFPLCPYNRNYLHFTTLSSPFFLHLFLLEWTSKGRILNFCDPIKAIILYGRNLVKIKMVYILTQRLQSTWNGISFMGSLLDPKGYIKFFTTSGGYHEAFSRTALVETAWIETPEVETAGVEIVQSETAYVGITGGEKAGVKTDWVETVWVQITWVQ